MQQGHPSDSNGTLASRAVGTGDRPWAESAATNLGVHDVSGLDANELALARVADELTHRFMAGEAVDLDQFLANHPELPEEVRTLLPLMRELAAAQKNGGDEASPPAIGSLDEEGRRVFGDYRIVREIGRGGMGLVYEAIQLPLGAQSRAQSAAAGRGSRSQSAPTLPARGPGRRAPPAPPHRAGLRRGGGGGRAVLRDAIH